MMTGIAADVHAVWRTGFAVRPGGKRGGMLPSLPSPTAPTTP